MDSHGQQLCNGDLEEQAKEIGQQKEEKKEIRQQKEGQKEKRQQKEGKKEKDEESPLKFMKTSDLQCVLPATDTLMMSSVTWTASGSEVRKCEGV